MTTWTACPNGHRYDSSLTSECPECAMLRRFMIPQKRFEPGGNENVGFHIVRKNAEEPEVSMNSNGSSIREEHHCPVPSSDLIDGSYGETMAVDCDGKHRAKREQLVTGWLVCVDGPEKGKDYRLHNANNYIGRSPGMDICISGDLMVFEDKHAVVAYNSQENNFFFSPSGGKSIVRLNGKPVLMPQEIKYGDRLQIGRTVFLFVPLCGIHFQWGNSQKSRSFSEV